MTDEDIEKLKKKMLKNFDDEKRISCCICRQVIARYDIEDKNFEYCKNKLSENFAHATCVNKMIKHKK